MKLELIFDPDYIENAVRKARNGVDIPDLRVEDLDPDWRIEFEERAAIIEYDGGMSREHAEAGALRDICHLMKQANQGVNPGSDRSL
jgi:hypothetical protein